MKTNQKNWKVKLLTEDWIVVLAASLILLLAIVVPAVMPKMPKTLLTTKAWLDAG
jgi:hypothetical protein